MKLKDLLKGIDVIECAANLDMDITGVELLM